MGFLRRRVRPYGGQHQWHNWFLLPPEPAPRPLQKVDRPDYTPFLNPFQYYASTANPNHARPASVQAIGQANDGRTHHQYDIHDFFAAVKAGNFPAVSYLKPAAYRDGHAGYSDPLDEQAFLVYVINTIEQTPEWSSTLILVTYNDCNSWDDQRLQRSQWQCDRARCILGRGKMWGRVDRTSGREPGNFARTRKMRLRTKAAAVGHLAVGKAELCLPHGDRSELYPALH